MTLLDGLLSPLRGSNVGALLNPGLGCIPPPLRGWCGLISSSAKQSNIATTDSGSARSFHRRWSLTTLDHNFEVSVITYREGSTWTALALEMNLRGYGSTEEAAHADLDEMLIAQVSYAVQMGDPESVWNRTA